MEHSIYEDGETEAEEIYSKPWDQTFVDRIKSDGISAYIDLGMLYE